MLFVPLHLVLHAPVRTAVRFSLQDCEGSGITAAPYGPDFTPWHAAFECPTSQGSLERGEMVDLGGIEINTNTRKGLTILLNCRRGYGHLFLGYSHATNSPVGLSSHEVIPKGSKGNRGRILR